MKNYWDSSALVEATVDLPLRKRLHDEGGFTRPHALSEIFSALTAGSLSIRTDGETAAQIIEGLADDLKFVDLTAPEIISALKKTKRLGVRGGRVHDFLHAGAAEKAGAEKIITLDENDFNDLTKLKIELV
jgi:predicted nucleic acid-binding protein